MKKSKPKSSIFKRALIPLYVGSGTCGIVVGAMLQDLRVGLFVLALALSLTTLLVATMWVNVALHEFGHVLAGLSLGYQFISAQVGGIEVARAKSGIKLQKSPNPLITGMARMKIPPSKATRLRYSLLIVAGPIGSSFCFALGLWICLNEPFSPDGPLLKTCAFFAGFTLALYGGIFVLASLLPYLSRGHPTDGLLIWRALKGGPEFERTMAFVVLQECLNAGELARDWPVASMEALIAKTDGSIEEVHGRYLRYYWLVDGGHIQEALGELNRSLELCHSIGPLAAHMADMLVQEQVFAHAWLLHDGEAVQALPKLEEPKGYLGMSGYARAMAALALLNDQPEEALRFVGRSRTALEQVEAQFGTHSNDDRAWLDAMESAALKLQGTYQNGA